MTEKVDLGDLERLTPISDQWGFDRGQPIDRVYIEDFLRRQSAAIAGTVLEIGEPLYTNMIGGERLGRAEILDIVDRPGVTYQTDLATGENVPNDRFDCALVTQTLQCIYDVAAAVRTLHRILKPGGVVLATVPGVTRTSEYEYPGQWFWSFTKASANRLFGDVFGPRNVHVQTYGNVLAAASFLYGLAAAELTRQQLEHADPDFPVIVAIRASK